MNGSPLEQLTCFCFFIIAFLQPLFKLWSFFNSALSCKIARLEHFNSLFIRFIYIWIGDLGLYTLFNSIPPWIKRCKHDSKPVYLLFLSPGKVHRWKFMIILLSFLPFALQQIFLSDMHAFLFHSTQPVCQLWECLLGPKLLWQKKKKAVNCSIFFKSSVVQYRLVVSSFTLWNKT